MRGMAILLGFNIAGVWIEKAGVPLPGNVIGLALFTAALFLRVVKVEWVESSAAWLLRHLLLFFAPIVVGTIAFLPLIGRNALPLLVSLVASTVVSLLVAGWVTTLLNRRKERSHDH
ncbi:MAG: CidA/LrgA family protein [Paenibacillaceae bacterium]|uniref:CidA/LrgA family protein n=1 Tax=Paenibacillus cymbidii TaxID=1639034 RepID=UPI0010802602|nr:CidA/LrgA family protein [Paenibacillus cymbidii]MBO9610160.1 CidA/LrgA family protein [Paenibacillaceae bacterium]